MVAKTSTQRTRRTTDVDSDLSDEDSDASADDLDLSDVLDQDEDVIRAAEEAQEEDLAEAAQLAELKVAVTDSEQTSTSMAVSKVSPQNIVGIGTCITA